MGWVNGVWRVDVFIFILMEEGGLMEFWRHLVAWGRVFFGRLIVRGWMGWLL